MNDLVSIVIPIYNMANSIEHTVDALLLQDYKEIEIILVDDGSKDNSYAICKQLATRDDRIKVFHIENRGAGPARNYGIEQAQGKWIYFPDADDYIEPHAISTMIAGTCNGVYDLVVFGFKSVNEHNKIVQKKSYYDCVKEAEDLRKDYSKHLGMTADFAIWNKFFNLEIIKRNKIKYPPLRRHQDEAFIAYYMCYAKRVHFIPDILYTYYVNSLQKEWQKYPLDYYKAVIGLYETRKETILTWNKNDIITHDCIRREYICKVIKSLELSFSPKMQTNKEERLEWMKNIINSTHIEQEETPSTLGLYQRIILSLLQKKRLMNVYYILQLKVNIECILHK